MPGPRPWRRVRSRSFDADLAEFPPAWARKKWPKRHPVPCKPYLPGFLRGERPTYYRREVDLGDFFHQRARSPKKQHKPIAMLVEARAYYSQDYRVNMLRAALRAGMSAMNMGVTQYWALIDADGSGFLDREEFEGVLRLSSVISTPMEIDACLEQVQDDMPTGEITQDVYYNWLLSTDDAWMNAPRRRQRDDDHRDVLLLKREAARFDSDVLEALDALWVLVDADGSGSVDRDEYLALHGHLYQAMHPQELLNLSQRKRKKAEDKALKIAEREWAFDSGGLSEMNRDRFKLSMFQLIDALLPQDGDFGPPRRQLDSEEFLRMLQWMVDRLCVLRDAHIEDPGEQARVRPQFRWDLEGDWLAALPALLFADEAEAAPRLAEGDRIIDRLTTKLDDEPEEVAARRRRRRRKLLPQAEQEEADAISLAEQEKRAVRSKVPVGKVYVQSSTHSSKKIEINPLAQWEAAQRQELYKEAERARRPSSEARPRQRGDSFEYEPSIKKVHVAARGKRRSRASAKQPGASPLKDKSSGYGKATLDPASIKVGDEFEGMSGITWRDCVVEAIGDAYLCYFPELDVREHLPLAHLRRKRRPRTRTVIKRRLSPQKIVKGEPRYSVDVAFTTYERSLFQQNTVLGYLYPMGSEKLRPVSRLGELPRSPHRTSREEAEMEPVFFKRPTLSRRTLSQRELQATRSGLDELDRTGYIGRDSYERPRTAGRMGTSPPRLPHVVDADVTGTQPPSRNSYTPRRASVSPAREAVLLEFRRRRVEARAEAARG